MNQEVLANLRQIAQDLISQGRPHKYSVVKIDDPWHVVVAENGNFSIRCDEAQRTVSTQAETRNLLEDLATLAVALYFMTGGFPGFSADLITGIQPALDNEFWIKRLAERKAPLSAYVLSHSTHSGKFTVRVSTIDASGPGSSVEIYGAISSRPGPAAVRPDLFPVRAPA